MVMEIYAMESCLLRAQKAAAAKGESAAQTMIDAARVFIHDAAERVEHEAKRAITAVHQSGMVTTQIAGLERFAERPPADSHAPRPRGAAGGAPAGRRSLPRR